jgi:hypothetical protein
MATQTNPAQQAAEQAQAKAQAAAGQAQSKLREQLDQRSSQLAEQAHQQVSDLRSVSEALRDQGKDRPAEAVDRLAGYVERAGSYLRDSDADSMLGDAEDFGRRKPGAVAAGALAVGLVASRFLKASSSRRYSARQSQPTTPPGLRTSAGAESVDVVPPLPVTPTPLGTPQPVTPSPLGTPQPVTPSPLGTPQPAMPGHPSAPRSGI